jgi:hypothetical protein
MWEGNVKTKRWQKMMVALVGLALIMGGCGGGSSDPTVPTEQTQDVGTTGVAVDPYIIGAVFVEVNEQGSTIQTSAPSDENGKFAFIKAVRQGSTIVMTTPGLHNGQPFKGVLKRQVDTDATELVVSPLTTLVASGLTVEEVVALFDPSMGVSAASVFANPMAAVEGKTQGTLAAADMQAMVASLAVNAALNMLNQDAENADLKAIVTAVVAVLFNDADANGMPDILDALRNTTDADVGDAVASAVAVTDYLVTTVETAVSEGSTTPVSDLSTAAGMVDSSLMNALVAGSVSGGGSVSIAPDPGTGEPVVTTPAGTIAENLVAAFLALDSAQADMLLADGGVKATPFLSAVDHFRAAKDLVGIDLTATLAEQDQALFFGALAEILAVAKPYSDFTANGMNNLGDVLDAFGIDATPAMRADFGAIPIEICTDVVDPYSGMVYYQDCTMVELAQDSPTSAELQQGLVNMLDSRLKNAVAALDAVSSNFQVTRTEPVLNSAGDTEYDYSDALMIKGIAQAMLAQLNIMQAYKHDIDIITPQVSTADFLANNTTLGQLEADSANHLAAAKTDLTNAADSALAAITAIKAETDADQRDDLISFYTESCTWDMTGMVCAEDPARMAQEIAQVEEDLGTFKQGLNNRVTFTQGTVETSDDESFDFFKFFNGVDLRAKAPAFIGDVPGTFPDPSMGGIIVDTVKANLNEDLDGDGSPDLIRGYTKFFDGLLDGSDSGNPGRAFVTWSPNGQWTIQFDTTAKSFALNAANYSTYPYVSIDESGTYVIQNGNLTLTNSNLASNLFVSMVATIATPIEDQYGIDVNVVVTGTDNVPTTSSQWWYMSWMATPF